MHEVTETETLCIRCHFEEEEALVLECLPWWQVVMLKTAHRQLRKRGYPAADMLRHAAWEMKVFRRYCPADVVAAIDAQHARLVPILQAQLN